jgi:hypothetical protein
VHPKTNKALNYLDLRELMIKAQLPNAESRTEATVSSKCRAMRQKIEDGLGNATDSGMGLSITIDKLRVFINKTLSILSAYQ